MENAPRYLDLIAQTLRTAIAQRSPSKAEATGCIAMETGLAWSELTFSAASHSRPSTNLESADPSAKPVDGNGHSRAGYRGLLWTALAQTSRRLHRGFSGPPKATHDRLREWINGDPTPVDQLAKLECAVASEGSAIVEAAWLAYSRLIAALHVDPKHECIGSCIGALERVALLQTSEGPFLTRTSSDNPEPAWYHEMQLLHVMMTFSSTAYSSKAALQSTKAAVERSARYIAAEVQPDHASSQPWAIHALLQVPEGVYLVDMMLHAAGVQEPRTMDAVSLLLLTDAYLCLRPVVR